MREKTRQFLYNRDGNGKWVKVRAREERARHLEGRWRSYTSQPSGNPAKKSKWRTQCLRQKSGEEDPAKTLYWRETDRAENYTIFLLSEWPGLFFTRWRPIDAVRSIQQPSKGFFAILCGIGHGRRREISERSYSMVLLDVFKMRPCEPFCVK